VWNGLTKESFVSDRIVSVCQSQFLLKPVWHQLFTGHQTSGDFQRSER